MVGGGTHSHPHDYTQKGLILDSKVVYRRDFVDFSLKWGEKSN